MPFFSSPPKRSLAVANQLRSLTRRLLHSRPVRGYNGLFVHDTAASPALKPRHTNTTVYPVSFLSDDALRSTGLADLTLQPHQVIGWLTLPTKDTAADVSSHFTPKSFIDNAVFEDFMHNVVLAKYAATDDPILAELAFNQKSGWIHVCDEREFAAQGRIPDPENIFGSLQIVDGKLQQGSYQRMPNHRMVNGSAGLFRLPEHLHKRLVNELVKKH